MQHPRPIPRPQVEAMPFPAMLPCYGVAVKMARRCATPSEFAGLSATLRLAALVRTQGRQVSLAAWLEDANLRHLARHLDHAAAIRGRG